MFNFVEYLKEGTWYGSQAKENPPDLYHGTTSNFLPSILKNGLNPKVYVDIHKHIAAREAHDTVYGGGILNKAEARGGMPVVLHIQLNPNSKYEWVIDPDYHGPNGYEGIKSVKNPHSFFTNKKVDRFCIVGWEDHKQNYYPVNPLEGILDS
jgi:hypothetical protein